MKEAPDGSGVAAAESPVGSDVPVRLEECGRNARADIPAPIRIHLAVSCVPTDRRIHDSKVRIVGVVEQDREYVPGVGRDR